MRIVLSGYYGFDNVGDEAILYSIIQALRNEDATIGITVLSNQPSKTAQTYGVEAVNRWSLKEVAAVLKQSDGLISGGGSLLQDETGFRSILYYGGIIKMAQVLKVPVFIYAQGMGPLNKGYSRSIVKHVLKKTEITVRDQASLDLLKTIGLKNRIDLVPDPVLGIPLRSQTSPWWDSKSFSGTVITVSVRDWPTTVNFKGKIARSLDHATQNGADIVFVPMHGEHDDQVSREVAELMKSDSHIAPFDASIEEKIVMIGKSNLLVGMRLHALIFASVMDTPFLALSYDPKINAFAEISGQPVAAHVSEMGWDGDSLYEHITSKLENEQEEILRLQEKVAPLKEKAQQTARQALQYFKSR